MTRLKVPYDDQVRCQPAGSHREGILYRSLRQRDDEIEQLRAFIWELISGSEHDLRERIRLQAEIERMRSELNGRLGQPFGDPAKS